jgi:hypothetical protein
MPYNEVKRKEMPEISRFYGIVIYILYNEHNPPHFHAKYGKYKAAFSIKELKLMEGSLPLEPFHMFSNGLFYIVMS